ncbi:hypothetical protein C8J56DRAFT_926227 [Mycena floridula]|nr:hypothetical protein C8J56DRAFT_926227 [Mycena floridula]
MDPTLLIQISSLNPKNIGKGGSLKDRMAALQGIGAFGSPSPPVAPKPALDRPKWKPPPSVPTVDDEQADAPGPVDETLVNEEVTGSEEALAEDPEEEERQRRAAIAARMAKLGGARVGMGPPVFGRTMSSKKEEPKPEPTETEVVTAPSEPSEPSVPRSMPVPAAPRRAAPPRKKAAKSPLPTPVDVEPANPVDLETPPSLNVEGIDNEKDIGGSADISTVDVTVDLKPRKEAIPEPLNLAPLEDDIEGPSHTSVDITAQWREPEEEEPSKPSAEELLVEEEKHEEAEQPEIEKEAEEPPAEEEEDDEARRKRVAEKLAKMGGVNPFALPPQRQPSLPQSPPPVEEDTGAASPDPVRKNSLDKFATERRPSTDSLPPRPASSKSPAASIKSPTASIKSPTASPVVQPSRRDSAEVENLPNPRRSSQSSISSSKFRSDSVEQREERGLSQDDTVSVKSRSLEHESGIPEEPEYPGGRSVEDEILTEEPDVIEEDITVEESEEEPRFVPPPPQRRDTLQATVEEPLMSPPPRPSFDDLPPTLKRSIPPPPRLVEEEQEEEEEEDMSNAPAFRLIPPTPATAMPDKRHVPTTRAAIQEEDENDDDIPLPRRNVPSPLGEARPMRSIPPPPPPAEEAQDETVLPTPPRRSPSLNKDSALIIPPHTGADDDESSSIEPGTALLSVSDPSEHEILDDDEGDPIDPVFYSPSRRASAVNLREAAQESEPKVEPEPTEDENQEDAEQARRRTIAERMARLGGIKFGAAPIHAVPHHASRSEESTEVSEAMEPSELTEEEEERARKERIAAKMASMGGMRFGMLPPGASPPAPPPRAAPPVPSSSHPEPDSEQESASTSDDGVKVEAEESEIEEINHEDALEEAPPPVPSRESRRTSVPQSRPPVPSTLPSRRESSNTGRKSSGDSTVTRRTSTSQKPQSEYVMVEEPEPVPPPTMHSPSTQWELPSIPDSSFDMNTDLSTSWTDDLASSLSTTSTPVSKSIPSSMTSEELIILWGRVGVQVVEVATNLFEKSKKALVGDGTYHGFVQAVLHEVPIAASAEPDSYGYLVYMQTGNSVQKRVTEIMPGDIVLLQEAKLKGHKGLQTYSQNVGTAAEPVVGVIGEFEHKKYKIRVFQASQHVGQQTVESVSYRLEDLKSGVVKIFRVLEA